MQANGQVQGPVTPHDYYKSEKWTLHLALHLGAPAADAFSEAVPAGHIYMGDHQVHTHGAVWLRLSRLHGSGRHRCHVRAHGAC